MRYISIVLVFIMFSIGAMAQDFPERSSMLVNDYAQALSAAETNALEAKLVAYNDSTSTEIAVVLIKSLGAYEVSDYAVKLAEQWGIGVKGKNNGVIILVAVEDRKVTIQTGYGMEGVLPDAICKKIVENELKPEFKQGNYYQGLDNASTAIIQYSKGEYHSDGKKKGKKQNIPFALVIFIFIVVVLILSKRGGGGTRINGGGNMAGGLPLWMLLNSGGSGRGSYGSFSSGSGGFGGFGGGSFGGGGASGSW